MKKERKMTQITSQNEQKEKTIRQKQYTKMIFLGNRNLIDVSSKC